MSSQVDYDAAIVGGGPAGSTCARVLRRAGWRVAILDRADFPRVKLCAGWLSEPVWEALEIPPDAYPRGLWPWERCHVTFGGERHTARVRGYFIRRYEFDDFLLRESGAEILTGRNVKRLERDGDAWTIDDALRARYLIGAGGTHCPVARKMAGKRPQPPVGVQEREFRLSAESVERTRPGGDGEPELLLHGDLRGYSWNVPKTDWINIGTGTVAAREVRAAWRSAREHFEGAGTVPAEAVPELERMQGHSYYLFHPDHLRACHERGALLVGDALGLAHPLTAEGIYPGVVSGRLAAEALLAGAPESYGARLEAHPAIAAYELVYRARELGARLAGGRAGGEGGHKPPRAAARLGRAALARGFAHLFAGGTPPAARLARDVVRRAASATARRQAAPPVPADSGRAGAAPPAAD